MASMFIDTFYYLSLMSRNDSDRERTIELSRHLTADTVTTAWVLTEVADAMSLPLHRELFVRLHNALRSDAHVKILGASEELFERGMGLYANRVDKAWSLTDCISFCVMTELGITDALTADHHFEQAGFRALLK
ncbi:MAG TPA: hypothetical protein VFC78_18345 [Tepidisphaeraceae bacterium]|nr:hypothetical protein [Tepidisphaeraceae bacterium]